jgi:hypothetical protein
MTTHPTLLERGGLPPLRLSGPPVSPLAESLPTANCLLFAPTSCHPQAKRTKPNTPLALSKTPLSTTTPLRQISKRPKPIPHSAFSPNLKLSSKAVRSEKGGAPKKESEKKICNFRIADYTSACSQSQIFGLWHFAEKLLGKESLLCART